MLEGRAGIGRQRIAGGEPYVRPFVCNNHYSGCGTGVRDCIEDEWMANLHLTASLHQAVLSRTASLVW